MKRKGYAEEYLLWLLLFDLVTVAGALFLSYVFRFKSSILSTELGWSPMDYLAIWPVAVACWILGLAQSHGYRPGTAVFDLDVVRRLLTGSIIAMALVITYVFFLRPGEFSRYMPVLCVMFVWPALVIERWIFQRVLERRAVRQMDRVLILGSGLVAERLARVIQKEPHHGMTLAGFITDNAEALGGQVGGLEDVPNAIYVGHVDSVETAVREHKAQQVIIVHPDMPFDRINRIINDCARAFAECRIVPSLLGSIIPETNVQNVAGIPLFDAQYSPLRGWNVAVKRVFDLTLSALALIVVSPVMALFALIVKLDSRGPILYKQQRIGLDGRRFNLYKFRSMTEAAEAQTGPVWAREGDQRVTRVGKWMRRFNIDELPQLFNVLRGDMSLVGPRPERPFFVKQFRDRIPRYMLRHRVKCGLTGWAQVNGLRGDTSIEARIAYDLYYIENWSLWLDIKILLMTFTAWKNAY